MSRVIDLIDRHKDSDKNSSPSYLQMQKVKPEICDSSKSSSICSEYAEYIDESLETLKQQLGIKFKNQNQAVDEIDNIEYISPLSVDHSNAQKSQNLMQSSDLDKTQENRDQDRHSILSFDDEDETMKLPESSLMKSTPSIKNTGKSNESFDNNKIRPKMNEDLSFCENNISLTNEIFGSAKNNTNIVADDNACVIDSDDELCNAINKKQASIKSKQDSKLQKEAEEEIIEFKSKMNPYKRQRG